MPIARQNGGKRKRSLKNQVGSIQIDRNMYIIQPNNNTQIRGLTRLLLREGLTHDARVKAQSQLKELQSRKASLEKNEIERNHQLKYRKIKFIEKKKVLRMIEKTRRKIAKSSDDTVKLEKLRKELKSQKEDLQYIEYFPRDRNYVSLFGNNAGKKDEIEALRSLASHAAQRHNRMFEDEDGFVAENKMSAVESKEEEDTVTNDVKDDFFVVQEDSTNKDRKRKINHGDTAHEGDYSDTYSNSSTIVLSASKKRKLKKKRKKKKKSS